MARAKLVLLISAFCLAGHLRHAAANDVDKSLWDLNAAVYKIATHHETYQYGKLSPESSPVLQSGCGDKCQPPLWFLTAFCPGASWYHSSDRTAEKAVKDALAAAGVTANTTTYTEAVTAAEKVDKEWKDLTPSQRRLRHNVCMREKIPELFTIDDARAPTVLIDSKPAVLIGFIMLFLVILGLVVQAFNLAARMPWLVVGSIVVLLGATVLIVFGQVPDPTPLSLEIGALNAELVKNTDESTVYYAIIALAAFVALLGISMPKSWQYVFSGYAGSTRSVSPIPVATSMQTASLVAPYAAYGRQELGMWAGVSMPETLDSFDDLTPKSIPLPAIEEDGKNVQTVFHPMLYVVGHDATWLAVILLFWVYISGWRSIVPIQHTNTASMFSILLVSASVSCCAARCLDPTLRAYKELKDVNPNKQQRYKYCVWVLAMLPFLLAVLISLTNALMLLGHVEPLDIVAWILFGVQTVEYLYISASLVPMYKDGPMFSQRLWNSWSLLRIVLALAAVGFIAFYPLVTTTGTVQKDVADAFVTSLTDATHENLSPTDAAGLIETKMRAWSQADRLQFKTTAEVNSWCAKAKFIFGEHDCRVGTGGYKLSPK